MQSLDWGFRVMLLKQHLWCSILLITFVAELYPNKQSKNGTAHNFTYNLQHRVILSFIYAKCLFFFYFKPSSLEPEGLLLPCFCCCNTTLLFKASFPPVCRPEGSRPGSSMSIGQVGWQIRWREQVTDMVDQSRDFTQLKTLVLSTAGAEGALRRE